MAITTMVMLNIPKITLKYNTQTNVALKAPFAIVPRDSKNAHRNNGGTSLICETELYNGRRTYKKN